MKIKNRAVDSFINFIAPLAIPLTLVKSWALLPLLVSSIGTRRREPLYFREIQYLAVVAICLIGNLIIGRDNNFN